MSVIKGTKICDGCGSVVNEFHESEDNNDYCFKCRPKRMSVIQLVEWLAKGNGFICIQGKSYQTYLNFTGRTMFGDVCLTWDDEIPYDEHNWVIHHFDETKNKNYWDIPTLEIYETDCAKNV